MYFGWKDIVAWFKNLFNFTKPKPKKKRNVRTKKVSKKS